MVAQKHNEMLFEQYLVSFLNSIKATVEEHIEGVANFAKPVGTCPDSPISVDGELRRLGTKLSNGALIAVDAKRLIHLLTHKYCADGVDENERSA